MTAALLLTGCLMDDGGSSRVPEGTGYVRFSLDLSRNDNVLMKSASADTTFTLDSAILVLSAPGVATQTYRYPISGRADLGNIVATSPVYGLAPLRNWKAVIITIDTSLSPLRRDTVHMDSLYFGVLVNDTTEVVKTVSPVYSILRVRFWSTAPESLPSAIRYLRVKINGVTRDSMALEGQGTGSNRAIFFPTITTGWVTDTEGRIQKSTDSGSSWTEQATGSNTVKNALWFNSATEGWAVGNGGLILKSNGSTWTSKTSGLSTDLNGVMFVDSDKGYAVGKGGRVLKTLDGGESWSIMSGGWFSLDDGTGNALNGVSFSGMTTGWGVADGGVIVKTTDAGASWSSQNSGTSNALKAVHALSTSNVVAVGAGGVIRRTTNGGSSTWSTISSGVSSELRDVHFATSNYGWAVGASGVIRRSGNGGSSWSGQTSGTTSQLNGVSSNGTDRVLAVGDNGTVRRRNSISNTSSFSSATNGVIGSTNLNSVYMLAGTNTAWVVGDGGFIAKNTHSDNDEWFRQGNGVTNKNLTHVHFADANYGWVTGEDGTILRTTDGGSNWTVQASGTSQDLYGVYATDDDSVYVSGASGVMLKTRSGGVVTTTSQDLNAVYFKGETGYVVGNAGVALRSTNGGVSWTALTGGSENLQATFISPSGNNVYAVGANGEYLTKSNADLGTVWDVRSSGTSQTLRGIWVSATEPGPASIFTVGDNGTIRLRNDGSIGNLTTSISTGSSDALYGLHCLGTTNTCWAAGDNGMVLRTTNGTTWTKLAQGAKAFDELLTYKYVKPGQANTVVIQAIDRVSPLRGYQSTVVLNLGAGQDSTLTSGMVRCGYGGPTCTE